MDLENLQKELFERKFKFGENIKVSFELLKRFMKENRKLVSILYVCFVVSTMFLINLGSFLKIIIQEEHYTVKMIIFMSIISILFIVVGVTTAIIMVIILLKISERIENQKTDLRKMTIFLKLLIFYVVFFIIEILSEILMKIFFYLFFNGNLTTETPTIVIIFLIFVFPYFEPIFFIRNKSIIDSLKGNWVLSKRNRIRLAAPIAILTIINMFLTRIIVWGGEYLVFNTDFSFHILIIILLGLPIAIIFGIIQLFVSLYANILRGIIFLNVEYQYLKENGNENDIENPA